MLNRDIGVNFGQDPNLNRPLRPETRDFMQRLRGSRDFEYFLLNQLSGDRNETGGNVERGRLGVWGENFVGRIFNAATVAEADGLLLPWRRWSNTYGRLYGEYYQAGGGQANYDALQTRFAEAGVPLELRQQMDGITEDNLRFNAESYIFRFTRVIKESVDMLEGLSRPVSAETIFRVQRIMDQPLYPEGGLIPEEALKPKVRRVEKQEDFNMTPEEEEQGILPLGASDTAWAIWNRVEVGSQVVVVPTGDAEIDSGDWGWKPGESGTVYGYSPLGAGDRMVFQPAVDHLALLVRDAKTDFLKSALIRQVVLNDASPQPLAK